MRSYAIAEWHEDETALVTRLRRLSEAGVDFVQLRAKRLGGRALYDLAGRCRSAVAAPSRLIINTRADVALGVGADGVHLPSDGMPVSAIRGLGIEFVGRSCHSIDEVRKAAAEGADYALLGPVFATRSKESPSAITPATLADAAVVGIPVFALGGISMDNLEELRGLPLAGIAAVTLYMNDEPVERIVEAVRTL